MGCNKILNVKNLYDEALREIMDFHRCGKGLDPSEIQMEVSSEQRDTVLIVVPQGKRLDAATSTSLKSTLVDFINGGATRIVLDLTGVEFIDSSGLGAMISILKTIGDDGDLALCGINQTVMSIFRLTRLDRIFQIHPTADEAVLALTGGA